MITDYKFIPTDSPDAKSIIDIMDEMQLDILSRGKNLRDRNLLETILTKELYLHLGWEPFSFQKILMNYVINYKDCCRRNKLEIVQTQLGKKLLLSLINWWNTNVLLQINRKKMF